MCTLNTAYCGQYGKTALAAVASAVVLFDPLLGSKFLEQCTVRVISSSKAGASMVLLVDSPTLCGVAALTTSVIRTTALGGVVKNLTARRVSCDSGATLRCAHHGLAASSTGPYSSFC